MCIDKYDKSKETEFLPQKSHFLVSISLQPDGVNLWIPNLDYLIHSLEYLRSTTLGCKGIRIRNPFILKISNCNILKIKLTRKLILVFIEIHLKF